ncbi:MAG: discoidin domain-containing protein, partial [Pseudomonadota bacterium]
MQDQAIDDFNDLSVWTAVTSGLAELVISSDQGPLGKVMRLDFDFKGSGGFVVARRAMTLDLVAPFAFHWRWRGLAPANQFEFKLADATGQNVWWFHRDALEFPADWQTLRIGHEDIEFAWGPSWGEPLQQLGALEFAIAAGPGGRGTIWIEALQFEDGRCLPEPLALASSSLPDHGPELALATHPGRGWLSATAPGGGHWYRLDFQVERPYGGLVIDWWPDRAPSAFEVLASSDGQTWQRLYQALRAGARRSYIALPGGRSRYLQLNLPGSVVGILEIDVKPYDFSRSPITFFQALARAEGRGSHPRYFYGEQSYWTSVGVWDGVTRALINEEGLVEPDLGSFSLEPSLFWRGEWLTWAAATQKTQTLERNDLPIPSVTWTWADGRLTITAGATGAGNRATLLLRYRIENLGLERLPGRLFVAIRPFQVTPPWQAFRGLGGISPIHTLAYRDGVVWVNGEPGGGKPVIPLDAVPFGAAAFDQGGVIEALRQG